MLKPLERSDERASGQSIRKTAGSCSQPKSGGLGNAVNVRGRDINIALARGSARADQAATRRKAFNRRYRFPTLLIIRRSS